MADLTKKNQNAIYLIEKGEQRLNVTDLKIFAEALGVRPVDLLPPDYLDESDRAPRFVSEDEGEPYISEPKGDNAAKSPENVVDFLLAENPNRSAWRLTSRVLIGKGYLPGDILILDMAATPLHRRCRLRAGL